MTLAKGCRRAAVARATSKSTARHPGRTDPTDRTVPTAMPRAARAAVARDKIGLCRCVHGTGLAVKW
jgi:hypothetical protein